MDKSSNSLLLHSLTGSLLMNLEIVVLGSFIIIIIIIICQGHMMHI